MVTIENERGKIELYDEIDEITQNKWHIFNKMLLQQAGGGSTLEDIDKHHFKLDGFLKAKKFEEAVQERKNLHLNQFNALMLLNFESLAFACLIKSINGEPVEVDSEDEIHEVSAAANRIATHKEVEDFVFNVKKKIAKYSGYIIQADTEAQAT